MATKKSQVEKSLAYAPQNPRQQMVRDRWRDSRLMVLTGEAGTGKTTAALGEAMSDVFAGRSRMVYLSRPVVPVDEEYGFLPGDLTEKFRPWMGAFADVLGDLSNSTLEGLSEFVEMIPLGMLRGRTLKFGTLIVDEAQNATWNQLVLAGSRCGRLGRVVLCGDPAQSDILWVGEPPLVRLAKRCHRLAGAEWVQFLPSDQRRDSFVTEFLAAVSDG